MADFVGELQKKGQIYLLTDNNIKSDSWSHFTGVKPKCCSSCCFPSPFVCACIPVFQTGDKSERGLRGSEGVNATETKVIALMVCVGGGGGEGSMTSLNVFTN